MNEIIGASSLADQGRQPRTNSKIVSTPVLSHAREGIAMAAAINSAITLLTISPIIEESPFGKRIKPLPWSRSGLDGGLPFINMNLVRHAACGFEFLGYLNSGSLNLSGTPRSDVNSRFGDFSTYGDKLSSLISISSVRAMGYGGRRRGQVSACL